jgi:hypothetical protein
MTSKLDPFGGGGIIHVDGDDDSSSQRMAARVATDERCRF